MPTYLAAPAARLAVAAALVCATTFANAFDFKGFVLGEPVTPKDVKEKLKISCGKGASGGQVCNGVTTVAGFVASANIVIDANGRLRRVMLSPNARNFEDIAKELISKFGEPASSQTSIVQNAMSAQYEQIELTWTDESGTLVRFAKYGGTIKDSSLYFGTASDQEIMFRSRAVKDDL